MNQLDFIDNAINATEVETLKWVLKMLRRWPTPDVINQIEQLVKELEDDSRG